MIGQISGVDPVRLVKVRRVDYQIESAAHHAATMRKDAGILTDAEAIQAEAILARADSAIAEARAAESGINSGALTDAEGMGIVRAACRRVTRAACELYDLPTLDASLSDEEPELDESYPGEDDPEFD